MTSELKRIKISLNLRDPQRESLDIFAKICSTLTMSKNRDINEELEKIKAICPTLSEFERDFPSFCFSLATGIGKTRLMGAMIALLHYDYGVKNFMVIAPNITIYNKLKKDFGDNNSPKYVFKGLDKFVTPPRIIDGDNYDQFRQVTFDSSVTINVFNIAKLYSDSKSKDGKPGRIKRLTEILGESYFEYLQSLPDLCIFMDESHHYHADKSFAVINELNPILGVEVTATPQIQKGSRTTPFKNIVYEYSLAHALNDEKYVKVPCVVTRKDFDPTQYTDEEIEHEKLKDGIKMHINTREALDTYSRLHPGKRLIKPFMLVVAKDTNHSKQIKEYICSDSFFKGYYKKKVLEINSSQSGSEKDENIAQLLNLESPDNEIEIVIHVNMLKEGWDVNNLYTIVPLRASASETLTEQTIGRGLRLPFGDRTGVEEIDKLSIISHDKYEAIINLANDPDSLVRKVYILNPDENPNDEQKETVPMPTVLETKISEQSYVEQLSFLVEAPEETSTETKLDIAKIVATETQKVVNDLQKRVHNIDEVKSAEMQDIAVKAVMTNVVSKAADLGISRENIEKCVKKAVQEISQMLTEHIIPIPQGVVQPKIEVKQYFDDFDLDTRNLNFHPSDDSTLLQTELREGGKTTAIDVSFANMPDSDTPENAIVMLIIQNEDIDYNVCSDLIYKLIGQLKAHLKGYLKSDDDVEKVLRQFKVNIADNIYAQMKSHFFHEDVAYSISTMRPFSKIETGFGGKYISDQIYDYRASMSPSEVPKRIFKGFKKSCHTMYKFDSNTERVFAIVLENDDEVLRWLCPNINQFNIYYDRNSGSRYQPDFVVETKDTIYMVETKDARKVNGDIDDVVLAKSKAAMKYCSEATEYNAQNGGKPWKYVLISSANVHFQSSLKFLVENSVVID